MTRPPFHFSGTSMRNLAPLISPSSSLFSASATTGHTNTAAHRGKNFMRRILAVLLQSPVELYSLTSLQCERALFARVADLQRIPEQRHDAGLRQFAISPIQIHCESPACFQSSD